MTLNQALNRENNNFDLLRLIAACLVIVGHAHFLVPNAPQQDFVRVALQFDYAGSLAVKFFFFLSGLVVANSLIEKRNVVAFAVARLCRLLPGMIVCVVLCALVLGPLVTQYSTKYYFANERTWTYIGQNILFSPQWDLPGVFIDHRNAAVNGSLWTLPLELLCYVVLAGFGLLSVLHNRLIGSAVMVGLIVYGLTSNNYLTSFGWVAAEARLLPPCFAFGALLALNKNQIQVNFQHLAGLILFSVLLRNIEAFEVMFYVTLFYGSIFIATTPPMLRARMPGDFSYGVYLYGFPVQQLMVFLFPHWDMHAHQAAVLAACLVLGSISWFLIERPGIQFGRAMVNWARRWQPDNGSNPVLPIEMSSNTGP